jgi:autotransporter-associated beta strand protein
MKFPLRPLSLLLLSAFSALGANAASLAWDPSGSFGGTVGAPTGSGGTGIWNTTSSFWSNSTGDVAWNNANGDNAIFAGTGATVTLGEAITVNNLNINSTGYTIAGGGFTLTINGTITNTQTGTISAKITGVDLTKAGSGTLVINNATANTYTGNTNIQAGTLQARASGALAATTTVNISGSATLDLRASQTVSGLTGSGTVNQSQTAGTTTLTVNSSSTDSAFSGLLRDGDATHILALTKAGTSTLTLTGTNSFQGATTVNAGTLATGSAGTFGGGNVSVVAGATLAFGNNASIGDLKSLTFASTSAIALNFTGTETVGSVFNSVTSTFLTDGTYDATALNSFFGGISAFSGTGSLTVSAIPEPATVAMLAGLSVLGLAALRRRRLF